MANTSTKLANIFLKNAIFNSSGPLSISVDELVKIAHSQSSLITTKTCTIEERNGNIQPRYVDLPLGSINSMGLPNLGFKKYLEAIPDLKKLKKPINFCIGGLTIEDNIFMINELQKQGLVDLIELNLSCPNLAGKPQMGYDFQIVENILKQSDKIKGNIPLGLKLPAYLDPIFFDEMSTIILSHNVSFIVCINSLGNSMIVDPETESVVISPKNGFGGLGGDYIKPVALANVHAFYQRIGHKVDIVGVGGIKSGTDAFEFILAGAKAIGLGTVLLKEGLESIARIEMELNNTMLEKGYKSIENFRGKLKYLS
jgi:dihydroorotate dehydrogenase (fumarate)